MSSFDKVYIDIFKILLLLMYKFRIFDVRCNVLLYVNIVLWHVLNYKSLYILELHYLVK